jgi:membrane fusion protein, heavy metal efflux system
VNDGAYVEAGTALATISKNKKLQLIANVSQKYFDQLSTVSGAKFKIQGTDKIYNTTQLNGQVISFGKSISTASPFIPVTFEIDNPGTIIPGVVVEVFLHTAPGENTLAIPVSALIEEQGIFYAFVQTSGEGFQKREVKTGSNDGEYIEVLSGIAEGERVVTKGAYHIKLASASGSIPAHGHEH